MSKDSVTIYGETGRQYRLENLDTVPECSCPAFRYQKLPVEQRTCKHLKAHLGSENEAERIRVAKGGLSTTVKDLLGREYRWIRE